MIVVGYCEERCSKVALKAWVVQTGNQKFEGALLRS